MDVYFVIFLIICLIIFLFEFIYFIMCFFDFIYLLICIFTYLTAFGIPPAPLAVAAEAESKGCWHG